MKSTTPFRIVGLCTAVAVSTLAADRRADQPATDQPAPYAPAPKAPVPPTTSETLQSIAGPVPRYPAHPSAEKPGKVAATKPVEPRIVIPTPPPPARPETVPTAGKPGHVWVPGHYVPLDGQWRWVAGEWGVPATPISVWVEARYDTKTKTWTPGYWQPDRPDPPEPAPAPSAKN